MKLRRLTVILTFAGGCAGEPSRLEVAPLAAGEWMVLDASDRGALVRLNHAAAPTVRMLTDRLTPVVTDTFSLHAGRSIIPMLRIAGGVFYTTLPGGPSLYRSPADPQLYAFEHEDAIWVFKAPGSMNQLTLDVGLDSLRAKQREGEIILYWSVNPVWSADGRFIAFLSNREAVRRGTRGQSIWMIDAYTGIQRALYDAPSISAHVDAVFGEEFVFSSSGAPGVFSVHPRTKQVTRLGDGYVMGAHFRGAALLLNNNGKLILLHGSTRDTLPGPPAGHVWSTHAAFSPSGEQLALYSTDQAGTYALHILPAGRAIEAFTLPAPPASGPAWTSETSLIFSISDGGAVQTLRATLH